MLFHSPHAILLSPYYFNFHSLFNKMAILPIHLGANTFVHTQVVEEFTCSDQVMSHCTKCVDIFIGTNNFDSQQLA